MTDEELAAIQARLSATSHLADGTRPWQTSGYNDEVWCGDGLLGEMFAPADAEFVAHAPADLAALLATVSMYRAIVEQVAAIEPYDCLWFDCDRADVPGDEHAHAAECPVTAARALLATGEGE